MLSLFSAASDSDNILKRYRRDFPSTSLFARISSRNVVNFSVFSLFWQHFLPDLFPYPLLWHLSSLSSFLWYSFFACVFSLDWPDSRPSQKFTGLSPFRPRRSGFESLRNQRRKVGCTDSILSGRPSYYAGSRAGDISCIKKNEKRPIFFGASSGVRTLDTPIKSQVLCQLS